MTARRRPSVLARCVRTATCVEDGARPGLQILRTPQPWRAARRPAPSWSSSTATSSRNRAGSRRCWRPSATRRSTWSPATRTSIRTRLYSKAFALYVVLPAAGGAGAVRPVAEFFANNVAFRRETFLAHPFKPPGDTSRGACVALAAELVPRRASRSGRRRRRRSRTRRRAGGVTSSCGHSRKAAIASRANADGGRRHSVRSRGFGRPRAASAVRILRGYGAVGLPFAQIPAALVVSWAYYACYFAGEIGTFLRVGAVRRVRV